MKIKKCKCGSTDFTLDESLGWKCWLDEDNGELSCKNSTNEINTIICDKCVKEYGYTNFKDINFN